MKTLRQLILMVLAILCLATAGLAQEAGPKQPTISVVISTPHDTVKSGSDVDLKVTVTNISDHKIRYYGSWGSRFRTEVRDSEGRLIQELPRPKFQPTAGSGMGPIPLEPGEEVSFPHGLTRGLVVPPTYDLSRPDKYTIQGEDYDIENKMTVKSNTITVTVVP